MHAQTSNHRRVASTGSTLRGACALLACASTALFSRRALAQRAGGADRAGASLAGQVGFFVGNDGYADFSTGFRAGYTFPFRLYLGGDLMLYVGNGRTILGVTPEVGYDVGVTRSFVIRPYGGIGFIDFAQGAGRGNNLFAEFYPGCEFLYYVTRGFFLGGDMRTPLFFETGGTAFGVNLLFTIGYKW
jgi:hypothetical protein